MPKERNDRKKVIHPRSRAAAQQARKAFHDQRVERRYKEKSHKLEALGERLKWFQDNTDESMLSYTKQESCEVVNQYLDRFKDELEQILIVNSMKGRSGSQHISRQQAINMTLDKERQEFTSSGFEIPDLCNKKNYKNFRDWNGQLRYIQNIKLRKVVQSDAAGCIKPDTDATQSDTDDQSSNKNSPISNNIDGSHSNHDKIDDTGTDVMMAE